MRSGYRMVVAFERAGEADRARYNLARIDAPAAAGAEPPARPRGALRRGRPARGLRRAGAEARGDPLDAAGAPPPATAAPAAGAPPHRCGDRAARRRPRRARGPRRRPLLGLRHEDARRGHPRLPRARVQGRRQGLRAHRPAREDQPLRRRRRRRAAAERARRQALAEHEGARPAAPLRRWPASCSTSTPSARCAQGHAVRARRRAADRLRGCLPLPRDARPARGDRRRQGRHGGRAADGPPDLRRRRLRQDRGRAARRAQGRGRRQAGDDARSDDDPRPAALRHLPRAPRRHRPSTSRWSPACASPPRSRTDRPALRRGQGRHPDRDPPPALRATSAARTSAC